MKKKPFIVFVVLLAVLAVGIPVWAFRADGDAANGREEVPSHLVKGQELFDTNCGACHTLYAAGTDGDFGPDLDQKLAPAGPPEGDTAKQQIDGFKQTVMNAIENGVDDPNTPGRMPAGIMVGPQAEQVAEFVAQVAGRG